MRNDLQAQTEKLKMLFFGKHNQDLTKDELYDKVLFLMNALDAQTEADTKWRTTRVITKKFKNLLADINE